MTQPAQEELDNTPLRFGKFKGKTPDEISEIDPGYVVWMYDNVWPHKCSKALYMFCKAESESDSGSLQFD